MTAAASSELHLVAAARPNLPKLAALWHALPAGFPLRPVLLHTGQHHDDSMFGAHLADLGLPAPDIALGVSGGGHASLVGRTMQAAGEVWAARRPAMVVVAGDVDGSLAAGIAARKLALPVAHLEAGLRCGDTDMPEEVNRRALDAVATLLWAPDEGSAARLLREGHAPGGVRAVGNAMVDTLLRNLPAARERPLPAGLRPGAYGVVTLHRAATVDRPDAFAAALRGLAEAARRLPFAWPAHPRARARMAEWGLAPPAGVVELPPLSYADFLALLAGARLVATDSGGVQEEATALSLPCLTLRAETERPVTLESGSSRLVAPDSLVEAVEEALSGRWPRGRPIPLWDGRGGGPDGRPPARIPRRTRPVTPRMVLMLSAAHPADDIRVVRKEGAALAAAGWRVRHLAPGAARTAMVEGVEIETYTRRPGWAGRLLNLPALAWRAAGSGAAVLHASEPDAWVAALLAGCWSGARVVIDVHEHYPSRLDAKLPRWVRPVARAALRLFCRLLGNAADAVVVAKDGLDADFAAPGRTVAVRNYALPAAVEPRRHLNGGPLRLAHAGALGRARGWPQMLEALALCPPGTTLSLIGRFTDGTEAEFAARASALGVADRIERLPWLPHAEALARLAECDVGLVLFQPGEENHRLALPHKLFDCMLAGLPVVAPVFAEEVATVVREAGCGVLVDSADPGAVASAVAALGDPERRAEMGEAGRHAALGRFGWAGEAARLVDLYDRLARQGAIRGVTGASTPAGEPEAAHPWHLVGEPAALDRSAPQQPGKPALYRP